MARINFPNEFAAVVKLFGKVKSKDDADAASSVIKPYVTEQGIDLAADETALTAAVAANDAFDAAAKDAEKLSEQRDNLFDVPWKDTEGCVQFLKKLFRNNVSKLGDWHITVDGRGRINYPSDFSARARLVLAFISKHSSYTPPTSPLQPYLDENDIDIARHKLDVEAAQVAHDDFVAADELKEMKREERDTTLAPLTTHVRGIGQFLVGLYDKNPKKAGAWDFEVDDSPQANKVRDGQVNPGATKTLINLVVGKVFRNIGSVPMNIYRGGSAEGTPVVLNAGASFTVVRGYGKMTIINPSDTTKAVYEGEFNG